MGIKEIIYGLRSSPSVQQLLTAPCYCDYVNRHMNRDKRGILFGFNLLHAFIL